jgi:hypothetical protein
MPIPSPLNAAIPKYLLKRSLQTKYALDVILLLEYTV